MEKIKVKGFRIDRQLTREEYQAEWAEHLSQLHKLAFSLEDIDKINVITKTMKKLVDQSFDRILEEQTA